MAQDDNRSPGIGVDVNGGGVPSSSPRLPEPLVPSRTRTSTGVPLGRSSSLVSFRRPSAASERINEILENARERAETMGAGTANPRSPQAPGSPISRHQTTNSAPIPEDSDVDELTGIISRGSDLNYQAIHSTNTHSSGPRARKTTPRNNSKPSSRHGDIHPPGLAPDMDYSRQVDSEQKHPSWWKTQLEKFQSIELENKGSVARDHLAIERTFLAWLRTSLAFASIGIAVTQLFRLNTSLEDGKHNSQHLKALRNMGKPLGSTFLGISILILFLGYKRYFLAQHWVMQGKFPASRGTVTIVAAVAFAIMIASLVVVIAIHPSTYEL